MLSQQLVAAMDPGKMAAVMLQRLTAAVTLLVVRTAAAAAMCQSCCPGRGCHQWVSAGLQKQQRWRLGIDAAMQAMGIMVCAA
jgi:hypothetical protein